MLTSGEVTMSKKHRSAVTGRYVPEGYAKKHPQTTVGESTKPKKKGK